MRVQDIMDQCILHVDKNGCLYIKHLNKKGWPEGVKKLTHSKAGSKFLLSELLSYIDHPEDKKYRIRQTQIQHILLHKEIL